MSTTVITGGTVVTAAERFAADLYIRDGVIVGLGHGLDIAADTVIDAAGCLLLPAGRPPRTPGLSVADHHDCGHVALRHRRRGAGRHHHDRQLRHAGIREPLPAALERSVRQAEDQAVVDYGFHVLVRDLGRAGSAASTNSSTPASAASSCSWPTRAS